MLSLINDDFLFYLLVFNTLRQLPKYFFYGLHLQASHSFDRFLVRAPFQVPPSFILYVVSKHWYKSLVKKIGSIWHLNQSFFEYLRLFWYNVFYTVWGNDLIVPAGRQNLFSDLGTTFKQFRAAKQHSNNIIVPKYESFCHIVCRNGKKEGTYTYLLIW